MRRSSAISSALSPTSTLTSNGRLGDLQDRAFVIKRNRSSCVFRSTPISGNIQHFHLLRVWATTGRPKEYGTVDPRRCRYLAGRVAAPQGIQPHGTLFGYSGDAQ